MRASWFRAGLGRTVRGCSLQDETTGSPEDTTVLCYVDCLRLESSICTESKGDSRKERCYAVIFQSWMQVLGTRSGCFTKTENMCDSGTYCHAYISGGAGPVVAIPSKQHKEAVLSPPGLVGAAFRPLSQSLCLSLCPCLCLSPWCHLSGRFPKVLVLTYHKHTFKILTDLQLSR